LLLKTKGDGKQTLFDDYGGGGVGDDDAGDFELEAQLD
jgi:hypothetical protein